MRVLFVCKTIHREKENPFVRVLAENIKKQGIQVDWGLEKFWNAYQDYDIIHFQWPEKVFGGGNKIDLEKISKHLDLLKEKGVKLLITCHNLEPHKKNGDLSRLYALLYTRCDAIHHMGEYSFDYLKERTGKEIYHFMVEHPAYYKLEEYPITKEEARKRLGIGPQAKVILSFGAFRFDEEREMTLKAFNGLDDPHKYLLAPGFFKDKTYLSYGYHKLLTLCSRKYKGLHFSKGFIPYSELPYYLIASDILFIQRKEILNSGNLPLGFSFGKTVVGPKKGNVGMILEKTNNPVFNPDDGQSVVAALKKALDIQLTCSKNNLDYAAEFMDQEKVAKKMVEEYRNLLKKV